MLKPRNPDESIKVAETVLRRRRRRVGPLKTKKKLGQKLQNEAIAAVKLVTPERLVLTARIRHFDSGRALRVQRTRDAPRVRFGETVKCLFVIRNSVFPMRTFVPNTSQSLIDLRTISPFVFYGCLNNETTRLLFAKKLCFKEVNEKGEEVHVPVSDNVLVEEKLGHLDILCIEDLIHAVQVCDPKNFFDKISTLLAPFKLGDLTKIEDGIDKFQNGKVHGDQGFNLNQLLAKIL